MQKNILRRKKEEARKAWKKLKVDPALVELEGITDEFMVTLGENGIKNLDDLGDLSREEFIELFPETKKTSDEIDTLIMAARAHWFDDEETGDEEAAKTNEEKKEAASN